MTHKKLNVPDIAGNYKKLPEIAKNHKKTPLLVHSFVLDCDIDLTLKKYIPEVTIKMLKLPEIAENYQILPKIVIYGSGIIIFAFVSVKNSLTSTIKPTHHFLDPKYPNNSF